MIKSVKVGGLNYDIKPVEWETDINGNMQFGLTHKDKALIEINALLNRQLQNQTLIHEIMHAVMFEAGFDLENEEDLVNRIGLVLYQVLKDNDFSFLKE